MKIRGKATYEDIEGGIWGIVGHDGEKYLPINMPEQLKLDGAQVEIRCTILKDAMSISMWGQIVRIHSFKTISQK